MLAPSTSHLSNYTDPAVLAVTSEKGLQILLVSDLWVHEIPF